MTDREVRINYLKETKATFAIVGNNILIENKVNVYNSQGKYLFTYER